MAKNKSHRRSGGVKIPLAVVAGFAPALVNIYNEAKASGWKRALQVQVPKSFMMYNPDNHEFGLAYANQGVGPIVLGVIAHYVIGNKLGVNRLLGRMNVPLVRI